MMAQKTLNSSITSQSLHTAVLNPQGSKTFLKKIVPASLAFILHQRLESNGNDFSTRTFEGTKFKVFKNNLKNFLFKEVQKWIIGAMDALDKNYLRELYLIVANKIDPNFFYESYKFQFKYLGSDMLSIGKPPTEEELKRSTSSLLEEIDGLQQHTKFNLEDITLKMAISYYEDVTPPDYIPPSFTVEEDMGKALTEALAKQPSIYLPLGILKTGHHIVKCRGKGETFAINLSLSSENLNKSEGTAIGAEDEPINHSITNSTDVIDIEEYTETETHQSPPNVGVRSIRSMNSTVSEEFDFMKERVRCLCDIPTKLNEIDAILCSKCLTLQHCVCEGYLKPSEVPVPYLCFACDDNFTLSPASKTKILGIHRLVVGYTYFTNKYPSEILDKLPADTRRQIIEKFKKVNLFYEENGNYKINKDWFKEKFLACFFKNSFKNKQVLPDSMTLEDSEKPEENSQVLEEQRYLNNRTSQDEAKLHQSTAGISGSKRRRI